MKPIIVFVFLLISLQSTAQNWFNDRVKISQSMETAELKEEPAQFQITIPHDTSASWLVNVGVSLKLSEGAGKLKWISKAGIEYHRNTLADSKQNNFQTSYSFLGQLRKGTKLPAPRGNRKERDSWYLSGDAKYVYDDIEEKHSIAGNALFTFRGRGNVAAINEYKRKVKNGENKNTRYYISPFAGLQLQESIKASDASAEGFIVRPIFKFAMYYDILKNDPINSDPMIRFSVDHTSRFDVINTTDYKEDYTQLLSTGIDWYLIYKPVKVSIGASFNYGSDPLKGLAKQQYWLLSINFLK